MAPENAEIFQVLQAGMILLCRTTLRRSGKQFLQHASKSQENIKDRL
jgi:hypothetical protein